MNKIYKVVWSKVKHCYVVTSELAKRQTKGCGARSLRMATVSLGVAASLLCSGAVLPVFGESVAEAAVTVSDAANPVNNVTPIGGVKNYPLAGAALGFKVYAIDVSKTTDKALVINGSSNNTESAKKGFVGLFSMEDDVTGGGVSLQNGVTVGALIGGGTYSGSDVTKNTAKVTGGTVDIGVYGGFAYSGKATGNSIEISGDSTVINSNPVGSNYDYSKVAGGGGKAGASKNTVTIKGGTINSTVYGGYSEDGVAGGSTAAEGNKVNITGGKINFLVYGGFSNHSNANFNAVTVSGGEFSTVFSSVYGGFSSQGNATNNSVSVSGGSLNDVCGGSGNGNADNNTVTVTGGTMMSVNGGSSVNGTANNNTIDISGGTIGSSDEGGRVVGAYHAGGGAATANNNKINIYKNAIIIGNVAGARDNYGYALASGNTITIDGSAVVTGDVAGVSGWGADKKENKVFIKNGSVTGDVYGGLLDYNAEYKGNLIKNEVNISGGKVTGNVYGGAIINKVIGDIKGNKVEITGGTLKEDNYVYGGYGISNSVGGSEAGDGNKVIVSGGEVKSTMVLGGFSSSGAAMGNSVEITGKGKVSRTVYGGYSTSGTAGGEGTNDGNKVIVSGGEAQDGVIGGCSVSGVATGNSVVISGGKVGLSTEATSNIYGGYSYKNAATGNKVTISNGSLGENYAVQIFGGYGGSGVADTNEVNLSGGTIGNYSKVSYIYGGWGSKTSASGNTVKITDGTLKGGVVTGGFTYNGTADSNIIKMSGGTLSNTSITGGKGSTSASGNKVTISGGQSGTVYGGVRSDGTPTVNQNEVTIKGKDTVVSEVYGGYGGAETNGNKVLIEESTVNNNVYGGDIDSTDTTMKAQNNEVTVKGATVKGSIYGAISFGGTATSNTVNISDGATAITGTVWGGLSANSDATENKVIINGGNIGSSVIGGNTTYGKNATDNTVTIEDGTITRGIYGGLSQNAPGTAINNKVIINGGIINGIVKGGESDKGNATNNTVTIKGGTVTERVIGGNANISGDANGNTITISGGTIGKEGAGTSIWGGYASSGGASNNTVTISGDAQLLGNVSIYGAEVHGTTDVANANNNTVNILAKIKASQLAGGNAAGTSSDNTLNIAATGVTAGSVYAFQTVALTSALTWSDGETVLSANNFDDDDSIKATLDISAATNLASATSGQMTLLASQTDNDLNALSLTYDGGTATLNSSNQSQIVKEGSLTPSTDNGVTVNAKGIHTVSLDAANSYKNVLYSVDNQAKSLSFAQVTFGKGSTARDLEDAFVFDDATTVDATNLTFAESTSAIAKGDSMTLAAGAKGLAAGTEVTKGKDKTVAVNYEDKQKIKYEATASGDVTTVAGAVKYTVGKVELTNVDLGGWNGTTADLTTGDTSGWTAEDGSVKVATGSFAAPDVAVGSSKTILKASGAFFADKNISGKNKYQETSFDETDSGIQFKGKQEKGVKADGTNLVYAAGAKNVTTATMTGEIRWSDGVYYENKEYTFTDSSETDISGVTFTADTDPLGKSMTLIKNAAGTVKEGSTPKFTVGLENTMLAATAEGEGTVGSGNLSFTVTGVTLDKVSVNGTGSDAVPEGWTASTTLTVDTNTMTVPSGATYGKPQSILTASSAMFKDDNITGDNKYGANPARFTDEDSTGEVTVVGQQKSGVKASADGKSLIYEVGKKEVSDVTLGEVKWAAGSELLDASSEEYDYSKAALNNKLNVTYDAPESVEAGKGESMTLLKANKTLADMAAQEKEYAYRYNPVSGVQIDANIMGKLAAKDGVVTFTAAENRANKLTFGDVEWKDSGALMTRPKNIIFAGADVDTTKIRFTNVIYLDADQQMTLVSDFGDSVGTVSGDKYLVGTAFEGEGAASLQGSDLVFRTKTSAGVSEQTHKAVMGVEATLALLRTGGEYQSKVMDGLGDPANAGKDGTTTMAAFGGGYSHDETGSHVSTKTWNAAVGVGARKETEKGTLQYGIFGEYGKASYTLHSDASKSDGDAHYAGGGLMAKWTNKHDVYAEASFRLGRVSDNANGLLRDAKGNAYGYDIDANYFGAHVGIGKIFNYKGGKSLDVYGKYFYTKRDGAEFDAVQHYNLDSVSSSALRLGARYGSNDKKWNWYGGLAYEYEFDGEATGTVNGTAIRAASIKGSSVRAELGMRMDATKTNPWQTDISIYGYGGKHRGFGGSVNVAYTF